MMRCRLWCVLSVLVHCSGLAWNSRLSGIQISKLNRRSGPGEGQPDNRKFNEPSATRQTQFYWTRLSGIISVCLAALPTYMELSEWSTGIVFGGRGKRGDPSCRGGGRSCVLPLWSEGFQRSLSSVPSFKMSSYRRIWWMPWCRR